MEWQPIETAPKDMTEFLAGRFTGNSNELHEGRIRVDWWRSRNGGDEYDGPGEFNARHWPATHWMPLPGPPQFSPPRHECVALQIGR